MLRKFVYQLTDENEILAGVKITIECKDETDASNTISSLSMNTSFKAKLIDSEMVIENECNNCGAIIKGLVWNSEFNEYKTGRMVCPVCDSIILPCNECKHHNICDNCPYRLSKQVLPVQNDSQDAILEDYIDDVKKFFDSMKCVLEDGVELKIPSHLLENENVYSRAYKILSKKTKEASYCNDNENGKRRYAAYYTLDNGLRIYGEWLIPEDLLNSKHDNDSDDIEFNSSLFNINTLDYFTIDWEAENESQNHR